MNLPALSVIVPNYNHGAYLPRCLDALFRQSVPPFEVIAIDDASKDNSLEVLADYARRYPNIRILRNERNQGVSYTLNRGIEVARGDFLFFPGADDEVTPGLFEKSLRLLAEHPQAALSCTVTRWSYVDSGLTWYMGAGMAERPCYLSPDDLVGVGKRGKLLICTSSAIIRKEPLIQAGKFIPELRWHSDWFATFVPAFRHGLCYVPELLSQFNIYTGSYSQSGMRGAEHRQVLLKLMELLTSPDCADVRPRIRDSGALSLFATPMLRLLLSQPEYRSFINATLLRRTFRRSAELIGKKILPVWLARWCLNRFYRMQT
jgi:glycosyltransferase involved in cell wall biosynthesis